MGDPRGPVHTEPLVEVPLCLAPLLSRHVSCHKKITRETHRGEKPNSSYRSEWIRLVFLFHAAASEALFRRNHLKNG